MPTIRALLALSGGKPSDAIEMLQIAGPYDPGDPRTWVGHFGPSIRSMCAARLIWQRTKASKPQLNSRKFSITGGSLSAIGALAHLQLGRALALSGDRTKAKAAFQDFLALWEDADPDIPVLKQAKKDYAALN